MGTGAPPRICRGHSGSARPSGIRLLVVFASVWKKLSVCVKVSGGNEINRLIKRANDGGGGDRKGGGGLGGAALLVKTGGGGVRDSSDKTGGGTSIHFGVTRRGDQGGTPPLLLLMLLPPPRDSRGRARTCPPSLTIPLRQNEVLAEGAAGERGHVTSM